MVKKKLIISAMALTMFTACHHPVQVPEEAVRTLCTFMLSTYPQATLQDVYKTCYQDFFGAEHMISDTVSAKAYLHYELEQMTNDEACNMPPMEPTGFRHRFVRMNLQQVLEGQLSEEELFRAFLQAANESTPVHDHWADEWAQIEAITLQVQPAWQNEELQAVLHEAAANNRAVRHSESFRNTYKPHYRIIRL